VPEGHSRERRKATVVVEASGTWIPGGGLMESRSGEGSVQEVRREEIADMKGWLWISSVAMVWLVWF